MCTLAVSLFNDQPSFPIRTGNNDLALLTASDLRALRDELRRWLADNRSGRQSHNAGLTPGRYMRKIAQIDSLLARLNAEGVDCE